MNALLKIRALEPLGDAPSGILIADDGTLLNDEVYEADAQKIFNFLYKTVPGGTYDCLLALMLAEERDALEIS